MGFYFRGLAFKQTMMILIVVTVVVGTIFGIMTSKMNGKLEQMTIDNGEQTSEASVTYINSIFDAAKTIGEEIAARLGSQEMTREELDNYLLRSLDVARNSVSQIIAVVTVSPVPTTMFMNGTRARGIPRLPAGRNRLSVNLSRSLSPSIRSPYSARIRRARMFWSVSLPLISRLISSRERFPRFRYPIRVSP